MNGIKFQDRALDPQDGISHQAAKPEWMNQFQDRLLIFKTVSHIRQRSRRLNAWPISSFLKIGNCETLLYFPGTSLVVSLKKG